MKGSQGIDFTLRATEKFFFSPITAYVRNSAFEVERWMAQVSFVFIPSWHVIQLSVVVLRELANHFAVMEKLFNG